MRSRLLPALGGGASRPAHRMVHEHDGGGPDVDARGLALGADGSTEGHDKLNKELGRGRRPFPSSRGLARGPEPDRGEGIRLGIPMQCNAIPLPPSPARCRLRSRRPQTLMHCRPMDRPSQQPLYYRHPSNIISHVS
jgi:hypothetical protein